MLVWKNLPILEARALLEIIDLFIKSYPLFGLPSAIPFSLIQALLVSNNMVPTAFEMNLFLFIPCYLTARKIFFVPIFDQKLAHEHIHVCVHNHELFPLITHVFQLSSEDKEHVLHMIWLRCLRTQKDTFMTSDCIGYPLARYPCLLLTYSFF